MFVQLFTIIAPVFVCVGIGYLLAWSGRAYPADSASFLTMHIGAPCLIFATLAKTHPDPATVGLIMAAAGSAMAISAVVATIVLKLAGLSLRGFVPSLVFSNNGNVGVPLSLFAFGEPGLALGITYFVVVSVCQFTMGPVISSGGLDLRRLGTTPMIYAVIAALFVILTGVSVPQWIQNTTGVLGGLTVPLLLMTLGHSLARLKVRQLRQSLLLSALRIGMGFAIGIVLSRVLPLDDLSRGVVILQASMPVAVFNYLFADQYKTEPEAVAGMVVISTLLSFASMPLLMWYVLHAA